MHHRAISDNCDLAAVAQQLAFSQLEQARLAIDRSADTVAPGITHRRGTDVLDHREHHVPHFALVFRSHHDNIWNGAKVCDVDQPVVCRTIATGDATAIETELYIQILN